MKASILVLAAALVILPIRQATNETRGIYDAVLKEIFKGEVPASFMVQAEYRTMRPPDDSTWQALGSVPTELRQKVTSAADAPPAAGDGHTGDQFAAGAHILPTNEITTLIRVGARDMNGYPALQQKYGARSMLSLSKPFGTSDGLDVLVHYVHGCGSACGTYGYVWLHRKTRTGPWVAKLVVTVRGMPGPALE